MENHMPFKITFGTDGWRGVIAEEYTFDNVRRCAQGFANYLLKQGRQGQWGVGGTDNGFKVRNETGGAIDPQGLKEIEASIPEDVKDVLRIAYSVGEAEGKIVKFDAAPPYMEHLTRDGLIDLDPIQ